MTNSLEDAVIAKVIKVYDDDTLSILTVNNLSSTLAFTPYSVRIIDKPIFIKNSLSKLILGKIVKIENISVDSDGYLLCKVSTYNWTNTNDVTKLTAVFGANGILYMQEKDRSYSHGIPHIT